MHGKSPAKHESSLTAQPKSPLTNEEAKILYTLQPGPEEGSPEHAKLAHDVGYGYCNLLGGILYAFVLCRLDISFAVTTLAKCLINPALEQCQALKRLAIYLRHDISLGALSIGNLLESPQYQWSTLYWTFQTQISLLFLGRPHTRILAHMVTPVSVISPIKMASTSGYATTMAGGAIAWRSKTQPITAQNVSEAELIAGNAAGKVIKYIHMVLTDLGFPPNGPSPIWEDNESVLKIVNHDRPTPRSRHIAIQLFWPSTVV